MHPARHCSLLLFGLTVAQVLTSPAWNNAARDLQVVELWSGVGHVAAAARKHGLRAATFEKNDDPLQNFLHQPGFMAAVTLVMRLAPGGLLAMGPTCSSFVWANSAKNQRKEDNSWTGDPEYQPSQVGNLEAQAAWFFFCLAAARGVEAFIENPTNSLIFKYIRCREGLLHLKDRVPSLGECNNTYRCAFSEEPMGQRIKKGFRFLATGSWIETVKRGCPCGNEPHRLCMTKNKKGKVSGNLDVMRESQSYPPDLGQALVNAWLARAQGQPTAATAVPAVPDVPAAAATAATAGSARPARHSGVANSSPASAPDLPFGQKRASHDPPPRKKRATTITSSSLPDRPFC